MITYSDRMIWQPLDPNKPIPKPTMEVLDLHCEECGHYWRVPVPEEFHDWRAEAESYRRAMNEMKAQMDELERELVDRFPLAARFMAEDKKRRMAELRLVLQACKVKLERIANQQESPDDNR